jgi:hypothetical protein
VNILKEGTNEYLDDFIRGFVNSVAWWFHCVSCSGCADPLVAGTRGDLADPAFCDGQTYCLRRPAGAVGRHVGGDDYSGRSSLFIASTSDLARSSVVPLSNSNRNDSGFSLRANYMSYGCRVTIAG